MLRNGEGIKNPSANAGDRGLIPDWEDSLLKEMGQPTPVFLPGKSHAQRRLVGYSPGGHKESDTARDYEHNAGKTVQRSSGFRMKC